MKHSRTTPTVATRGPLATQSNDEQRERLAMASRLSARLAALDDEREIVQVTVDELDRTFGYFLAVIHRLDRHDETLRLVAVAGELASRLDDIGQWAQPIEVGVLGRVARRGEPVIVHDTRLDPDFFTPDERVESRSELALPIRVAGEIWGVLNLEAADVGAFGEDDLLLATMIAAQVGAAIHRSRLSHDREDTFMTALGVLCDALETKDSYTAAHAREVADLCEQVGARLGVRGEELRNLQLRARCCTTSARSACARRSCASRVRSRTTSSRRSSSTPSSARTCSRASPPSPTSSRWCARPTSAGTATAIPTGCARRRSRSAPA